MIQLPEKYKELKVNRRVTRSILLYGAAMDAKKPLLEETKLVEVRMGWSVHLLIMNEENKANKAWNETVREI